MENSPWWMKYLEKFLELDIPKKLSVKKCTHKKIKTRR